MPINLETCVEPHLDSFTASLELPPENRTVTEATI